VPGKNLFGLLGSGIRANPLRGGAKGLSPKLREQEERCARNPSGLKSFEALNPQTNRLSANTRPTSEQERCDALHAKAYKLIGPSASFH
jgi:hypothetical protein